MKLNKITLNLNSDFTRCIYAFINNGFDCAWIPVCYCAKAGSILDDLKFFKRLYGIHNLSIKLIHDSEKKDDDFYSDFFENFEEPEDY